MKKCDKCGYEISSLEAKSVYQLTVLGVFQRFQKDEANNDIIFDGLMVADVIHIAGKI